MILDSLVAKGYQVEFHSHAEAILVADFPEALVELSGVLDNLSIPVEKLVRSGGGETETTRELDAHLRR